MFFKFFVHYKYNYIIKLFNSILNNLFDYLIYFNDIETFFFDKQSHIYGKAIIEYQYIVKKYNIIILSNNYISVISILVIL